MSTERLTDGLVVDVADRTAVVPAGMRLSTLNDTLEPDGLFFPIDLAADPSLGGMAATNTGGARMLRYGDVRRRVLGIEAVIADDDASVIDDLSVLRKDNTGIDVSALFLGSSGALGIITRVAVDLAVRPRSRAAMLFLPADAEAAVRLLVAVEHAASDVLSAFEVMSIEAVRSVLEEMDDVANPFGSDGVPELSILVELSGADDVDDRLLDIADAQSSTGDLTDAIVLPAAKAWDLRHRITEALAMTGVVVGFDISVPRSALAGFRTEARSAVVAAFPRATTADFGHWGDGGMHFNIVFPPGEPPSADEREELPRARVRARGRRSRRQLQRRARHRTAQRLVVGPHHSPGDESHHPSRQDGVRSARRSRPPRPAVLRPVSRRSGHEVGIAGAVPRTPRARARATPPFGPP